MADQARIDELRLFALRTIMAAADMHCSSASTSGPALLAVGKLAQTAQLEDSLFDEVEVKALERELESLAATP